MLATVAWKSRPIAGSAMPTTVASSAAMPDPSTVAASTQRPLPLAYLRVGAALTTVQATAQVLVDVAAQPPGLTAVQHRTGQRTGEERAERERGPADAPSQPPPQLPGKRRPGDNQQAARDREHTAPVRPGGDVGTGPLGGAAGGGHAVHLVQLGDQLDLYPHDRQRLRRYFGRERRQHGQRGPGPGGTADGRRRECRALDQQGGDLVVGAARKLGAQRGLIPDPEPRSHRDDLRGEPAAGRGGAAAGGPGTAPRRLRAALGGTCAEPGRIRSPLRESGAAADAPRRARHAVQGPGQPPPVRRLLRLRQFDGDLGRLARGGILIRDLPAIRTGHIRQPTRSRDRVSPGRGSEIARVRTASARSKIIHYMHYLYRTDRL